MRGIFKKIAIRAISIVLIACPEGLQISGQFTDFERFGLVPKLAQTVRNRKARELLLINPRDKNPLYYSGHKPLGKFW